MAADISLETRIVGGVSCNGLINQVVLIEASAV